MKAALFAIAACLVAWLASAPQAFGHAGGASSSYPEASETSCRALYDQLMANGKITVTRGSILGIPNVWTYYATPELAMRASAFADYSIPIVIPTLDVEECFLGYIRFTTAPPGA